jgi:peptidylprolyl isomerase
MLNIEYNFHMKKLLILIFTPLVITACTSPSDISSIDTTLESSSKSLGNVNMVNDITSQNSVKGANTSNEEKADLRLSKEDQKAITQGSEQTGAKPAKPKTNNVPQTTLGPTDKDTTTLQVQETMPGKGAEATEGKQVAVHYIGRLTSGKEFDNSYKRGQPIIFTLGVGQVIKGWDVGIAGMKVGGRRHLLIPPQLAYGDNSPTPDIPNGATLIFDVELVDVK